MGVVLRSSAPWAMSGASLDLDFTHARAALSGVPAPLIGLLSNSNSSGGYVTWADGHASPVPANTPRMSDLGLLCEMASINLALWSNDFTQSAWTKTSVTAALNQTGPDLAGNSASLLTASANNATVLQGITSSSATRTLAISIRRIAGSGSISLTQDDSTWTDVTSFLSGKWQRISVAQSSLANPVIGIKFGSSGDQIAVWCADEEANGNQFVLSPIVTQGSAVTRSADQVSLTGGIAPALVQGAASAFAQSYQSAAGTGWSGTFFDFGGGAIAQFNNSQTQLILNNGSSSAAATLGSGSASGVVKAAFGMDGSSFTAIANGGTKASNAAAWAGNTGTVYLGFKNGGGNVNWLNGYLQRFAAGPAKGQFDNRTQ